MWQEATPVGMPRQLAGLGLFAFYPPYRYIYSLYPLISTDYFCAYPTGVVHRGRPVLPNIHAQSRAVGERVQDNLGDCLVDRLLQGWIMSSCASLLP